MNLARRRIEDDAPLLNQVRVLPPLVLKGETDEQETTH